MSDKECPDCGKPVSDAYCQCWRNQTWSDAYAMAENEIELLRSQISSLEKQLTEAKAKNDPTHVCIGHDKQMVEELAEYKEALKEAREALGYIVNRENYTFAECTEAEEIVGRAKKALAKLEKLK